MSTKALRFQWAQLCALTLIHFAVDMYGGALPAVLPRIRAEFGLSLTRGITLITLLNITCNSIQLVAGPLRAKKSRPLFIPLGLLLASSVCLFGLAPRTDSGFWWLCAMVFVSGVGIAMMHPEGLRAIHSLERIKPALSTAFFMNAGFLGFSGGAVISASLVYLLGLKGLLWLFLFPVIGILLTIFLKIRLAVEAEGHQPDKTIDNRAISLRVLFLMAVPTATASTIIVALLPTRLNEIGFALYFGGLPLVLFGGGGVAGSLFWAWLAGRKGELACIVLAAFVAIPFFIANFALIEHSWAIWFLVPAGFCAAAVYSLVVATARQVIGGNIGGRMGLMVGGVWGTASIVLMALGPVADKIGVKWVLDFSWLGYLITGLIGLRLIRKGGAAVEKTVPVVFAGPDLLGGKGG